MAKRNSGRALLFGLVVGLTLGLALCAWPQGGGYVGGFCSLLSGGTITGDLTITGALSVTGATTMTLGGTSEAGQVIDVTSTEALLVRKNSDGGDVFAVDTTNSNLLATSSTMRLARLGLGVAAHASNALHFVQNSVVSAVDNAATGTLTLITLNSSDQMVFGVPIVTGSTEFTADSGVVTHSDFPVSATPAAGTAEEYWFRMDANNVAGVVGESDGAGSIQKYGLELASALSLGDAGTIANNDATPDVTGAVVWNVASDADGTAITDLDNPVVGAIYSLVGGGGASPMTIADAGNFNLSAAWTAAADDVLTLLVQADNDYVEIARVDN